MVAACTGADLQEHGPEGAGGVRTGRGEAAEIHCADGPGQGGPLPHHGSPGGKQEPC